MLNTKIIIFSVVIAIAAILISIKADGEEKFYDFCLKKSYKFYKEGFMSKDGRIMDPDKDNITTSEGQSYIMLRSLTIGDKETFDLCYKWAKNNLQRKDKLFSWLWGRDSNGDYKILDENSASDADVDIAFSLILAYEAWGNHQYLQEAIPIINSIWNNEIKRIGKYLVLMPGVEQTNSDIIEINPSYFSPYAFRFFQKYDRLHDWNCLIDSSYHYIMAASAKTETGLPPNWFLLKENQGQSEPEIVLEDSSRSDFSYDAIRVFIRTYLDYVRTGEKKALPILEKSYFFIDKWKESKVFYTNYKANGQLRDKNQFIGAIACITPAIALYDQKTALEIYENHLKSYFLNPKYWEAKKDYYAKNLLWFGCYLYNKDSKAYSDMHKRRITGY